jgi:hypothetical protein
LLQAESRSLLKVVAVFAQGLTSSHEASPNISDVFSVGCKLKVQKGGKKSLIDCDSRKKHT